MTKQEARRIVKAHRAALTRSEALGFSRKICEILVASVYYQRAKQVFCYASLPGEAETGTLTERILQDGKILALPRVSNGEIRFYRVDSLSRLQPGCFKVAEPDASCVEIEPDGSGILVMPGVAFDKEKRRVGYGGGYYDRYLEKYGKCFLRKLALAYDFQIFDFLDEAVFDRRPDEIITAGGFL